MVAIIKDIYKQWYQLLKIVTSNLQWQLQTMVVAVNGSHNGSKFQWWFQSIIVVSNCSCCQRKLLTMIQTIRLFECREVNDYLSETEINESYDLSSQNFLAALTINTRHTNKRETLETSSKL